MAVAYDASSESHAGTTGSASEASFSWTHTPVGTPKGVLVFVMTNADASDVTSVTYDGITVPAVSGGEAADTAAEPGRCKAFYLGSGLPTGAKTIVVNRTNNADVLYAVAFTVTAGADTEVHTPGIVLLQNDGTLAVQSVDDGSPGTNSVRFAGINSGLAAPPTQGAGSTQGPGIDFGSRAAGTVRETTAGQGARNVGWSSGTSDDRAAVHLAVREVTSLTQLVGKIPTGENVDGVDLSPASAAALLVGNVDSGQAVRGVNATPASAVTLLAGKVAPAEDVRGVDLSSPELLLVGKIASGQAVRGTDLAPSTATQLVGKIASAEDVRGTDLTPSTVTLLVGKVATGAAVRGTDLAPGTANLSVGKIASGEAVYGVSFAATSELEVGKITTAGAVRGVTMTATGSAPLSLGKLASTSTVRGATLQPGTVTMTPGKVAGTGAARGVTLQPLTATLAPGKIVGAAVIYGVGLEYGAPYVLSTMALSARHAHDLSLGAVSQRSLTLGATHAHDLSLGVRQLTLSLAAARRHELDLEAAIT